MSSGQPGNTDVAIFVIDWLSAGLNVALAWFLGGICSILGTVSVHICDLGGRSGASFERSANVGIGGLLDGATGTLWDPSRQVLLLG